MNVAYISALAALAGSALGALASFATTWLTQHYQGEMQRRSQESGRREKLFGEFIDQASTLLADALTHSLEDPSKLVTLYAVMTSCASSPIAAARNCEACCDHALGGAHAQLTPSAVNGGAARLPVFVGVLQPRAHEA